MCAQIILRPRLQTSGDMKHRHSTMPGEPMFADDNVEGGPEMRTKSSHKLSRREWLTGVTAVAATATAPARHAAAQAGAARPYRIDTHHHYTGDWAPGPTIEGMDQNLSGSTRGVSGVNETALENQFDTPRAVVSLVINGTIRCPDIRFIFSHG